MTEENAAFLTWLAARHPVDVFAMAAAFIMAVLALALWLASLHADRLALRLFALRYLLAAAGWLWLHPRALAPQAEAPFASMLVAVALLALTAWALDEFLGSSTRRRRRGIAAAAALAVAGLALLKWWVPASALGIYVVMGAAMAWCAGVAWRAGQREPGVGHRGVALAFASYPALLLGVLPFAGLHRALDLSYLVALPAVLVGATVLVVSLTRAAKRAAVELQRRQAAERALRALNATLEQQVAARTESLRALVEGMEMFTRNVSHDLRGSLAGATGLARLVREALAKGDPQRARRLVEPLPGALAHLSDLVRGLLELSRLEDRPLQRAPVALRELAQRATDALALDPETAPLVRSVALEWRELPEVQADAALVQQVFANLIGNALRFAASAPQGRARVEVGARTQDGVAACYVRDSGPGFEPARAAELFKPFARLHDGHLSHHGIGLSIVRRIVERHGGRAWAESVPGQGATFWFTLPA